MQACDEPRMARTESNCRRLVVYLLGGILLALVNSAARSEESSAAAAVAASPTAAPAPADEALPTPPRNPLAVAESVLSDPFASSSFGAPDEHDAAFLDSSAADFDGWEPLADGGLWPGHDAPEVRPFDWFRKWGFRHSSTDGRHVDKSVPLERASWLNRPYHLDWFAGPLLGDELSSGVEQQSALISGLRVGWDFDYYWGLEWRLGWSNPDLNSTHFSGIQPGDYFLSDIDLVYYPWGDTKVRPFFQWGMGMVQVETALDETVRQRTTLLTMPFGAGVQFSLTRWAALRLEVVDNWAFGGDEVNTLSNWSFTAGMEMRLGARPKSYWPWRSSRTVW